MKAPPALTPFQQALQASLENRKTAGQPTPASVDYGYAARAERTAAADVGDTYVVAAATRIEYANPREAGHDDNRWPRTVLENTMPASATGSIAPGDYTDLVLAAAARRGVDETQFWTGPRTVIVTETYQIVPGPESRPLQTAALLVNESSTLADILLGVTYSGPRIRYILEIGGDWGTYAKAGFVFDYGLGLRFPMRVNMNVPSPMYQGSNYALQSSVTGADWSAADYQRAGVAAEGGREIFTRFEFFLGVKAAVLGLTVVDWALEVNINPQSAAGGNLGAYDPFNQSLFAPLSYILIPAETGISKVIIGLLDFQFSVGVGLKFTPGVSASRINATWRTDGDARGSGTVQYTSQSPVSSGPFEAGDFSSTSDARLRLQNFEYAFDTFTLHMSAAFFFTFFDGDDVIGIVQVGEWPFADINVHDLVGALAFRAHQGTSDVVTVSSNVDSPLEVRQFTHLGVVDPGADVPVTTLVTNRGQTALDVSVVDSVCGARSLGNLPPNEARSYVCTATIEHDTYVTATASAPLAGAGIATDSADLRIYSRDGLIGGGTAETCTQDSLDAELSGTATVLNATCGSAQHTIVLTRTLQPGRDITLRGGGLLALSSADQLRCFDVPAGITLGLEDLTIAHCAALRQDPAVPEGGGAIRNAGTVNATRVRFAENSADAGGAIHSSPSGRLVIANSVFDANRASSGGGALYNEGQATVSAATFNANTAIGGGAILSWKSADLRITDSQFTGNSAGNGGAIESGERASLYVDTTALTGNRASGFGGAVALFENGSAIVRNSTISNNRAAHGGAIAALHNANIDISNSDVLTNDAAISGGGVAGFDAAQLALHNSRIISNTASYRGGGIASHNTTRLVVDQGSVIARNTAGFDGGGADIWGTSLFESATITANTTTYGGGGLRVRETGSATVRDSAISDNSVVRYGGGIHSSGAVTLSNTVVTGNSAGIDGGGLFNDGVATVTHSQFGNTTGGGNQAAGSGGGLVNWQGTLTIEADSSVENNGAMFGAGVANGGGGVVRISASRIAGNQAAWRGGGLVNFADSVIDISAGSVVDNNHAAIVDATLTDAGGGGLFNFERSTVVISDSVFSNNTVSSINNSPGGGGAIRNMAGVVSLWRVQMRANGATYGGAIHNGGTDDGSHGGVQNARLRIEQSSFTANEAAQGGGALYNEGQAMVVATSIGDPAAGHGTYNGAGSGAAIANGAPIGSPLQATLVISTSTLAHNRARANGGALSNWGQGQLTVTNSTLSGNQVSDSDGRGGALANYDHASASFTDSTLANNSAATGPAIDNSQSSSPVTLARSILSNESAAAQCNGLLVSQSYNVAIDDSCGLSSAAQDRIVAQALLAALADNGGNTWTHALLANSPALDLIPVAACGALIDQRSMPRPQGTGCDAGAYEKWQGEVFPVAAAANTVLYDPFEPASVGTPYGSVGYVASRTNLGTAAALTPGGYLRYTLNRWYDGGTASAIKGSVELWVLPQSYGEVLDINWWAANATPSDGHVLHLGLAPATGRVTYSVWNGRGDGSLTGVTPVPLQRWTHIAIAWGPGGTKLYVNGRLDAQSRANLYPLLQPVNYAYLNVWGDVGFVGAVDELRISSAALAATEIAYHATGVRDSFNRQDGPLGAKWYGPEGLGGYQIDSQSVMVLGGGPIYWRGPSLGVNQAAFMTLSRIDAATESEHTLLLKVQGNPPNWRKGAVAVAYRAAQGGVSINVCRVLKARNECVWTNYGLIEGRLMDGDIFSARIDATGRLTVERNGLPLAAVTLTPSDSAYFATRGGFTGVWFMKQGLPIAARLDDFGGGQYVPPSAIATTRLAPVDDETPVAPVSEALDSELNQPPAIYLPVIMQLD